MDGFLLESCEFALAAMADIDAVDALHAKVKLQEGTLWDDEYPTRAFIEEDVQANALFVLRCAGGIISAIALLEEDDVGEDLPWTPAKACVLARLCVKPALQGKHIGEHMMRLTLAEAKKRGYEAARHLAAVLNPQSLRLYDRMGYKKLGQVHMYGADFYGYEMML